jgi:hypothetical protein
VAVGVLFRYRSEPMGGAILSCASTPGSGPDNRFPRNSINFEFIKDRTSEGVGLFKIGWEW